MSAASKQTVKAEPSTALTLPQRAAVALKSAELELKLSELAQASSAITAITNPAGYQQCHSSRMALKRERIELEKRAKGAREDATNFSRAVIAEEKRLIGIIEPEEARLKGIQDTHDAAIAAAQKAKADAERARVAALQAKVQEIRDTPAQCAGMSADDIGVSIDLLSAQVINDSFAELKDQAESVRQTVLAQLGKMQSAATAREAEAIRVREEAVRLEAQRKAQEEEARRQREELAAARAEAERVAAERQKADDAARSAELAKLAAERQRIAEEERQAKARIAEQQRVIELQRAEQDRVERLRREEEDRKRRLAEEVAAAEGRRKQEEADRQATELARQRARLELERDELEARKREEERQAGIVKALESIKAKEAAVLNSGRLEPWAEEACDQIDAGFFSGDSFHSATALTRFEWYMGRWQRQIVEIREMLTQESANVAN